MIRSTEQLKEWLENEKEKRIKQRELLKEKIRREKKEQQKRIKLLRKRQEEKQKEEEKKKEEEVHTISRTIVIYSTRYIERFSSYEDLYTTREELQEAEERLEGRIKWDVWDKIIAETRKLISDY